MKGKWSSLISLLLAALLVMVACGPTPEPTMEQPAADTPEMLVVIPGTIQEQLGCGDNWKPDCEASALSYDSGSGLWTGTFDLIAGSYEVKVAIGGSWDENYGAGGAPGGDNIQFGLDSDAPVTFTYDPETHVLKVASDALGEFVAEEPEPVDKDVEFTLVVVPGTMQEQLGCESNWNPECEATALAYDDANGKWVGTFDLTAGSYEYKIAVNGSWDINFGQDGQPGGDNLTLTLAKDAPVTFTFDPATKLVEVESTGMDTKPPAASVEGGLVIWADQTRVPALIDLAEEFEAEYGIQIVVEQLGLGDVRDVFVVAGPAGEGPDIIVGAHDWLGELVTSGLLAPIDLGDKAKDFAPAALQAFSYNGELYGLPNAIENVAFFRNVDLVPDAPTTWDEVVAISRDLAANNDDDIETNQYGFIRMEADPYHFFPIMTAFGGYIFGLNEDGSYNPQDVGLDSAGSIAAAQWYADYLAEDLQPPSVDGETMVAWFESGKSAMTITGPWYLPRIKESGVNYAISNIPSATATGHPFLGAQGLMVSAFSKEPLMAQIFLTEFVATMETMRAMYESQPRPPAYLPLLEELDDPDLVAFAEAGLEALPMPTIPEMSAVWESWTNALTLVAQGSDTPESAFTNAAQQIRDAIAE